jgi:predicted metal-dependent peptidase
MNNLSNYHDLNKQEQELQQQQVELQEKLKEMLQQMSDQQDQEQSSQGGGDGEPSDGDGEGGDDFEGLHPLDEHDWQEQGYDLDDLDENGNPIEGREKSGQISEELKKMAYDGAIQQALSEARSQPGSIPQHIIQAMEERFKPPKVNWQRELRDYVGKKQSQLIESTRSRLNRRLGLVAPGQRKLYSPEILIAIDSSGSVSNQMFCSFMCELRGILKGQEDKVEVFFFDSEVVPNKLKLSDLKVMPKRPAMGGTDFQKAIDYANSVKPDLLIVFTDGDASDPKKACCSLLWALIGQNEGKHLTTGKKIKIDAKELLEKHKNSI